MKLKYIIISSLTLLLMALGIGTVSFYLYKVYKPTNTAPVTANNTASTTHPADLFKAQLKQEECAIWQELAALGISKERYEAEYAKLRKEFLKDDVPFSDKKVSASTQQLIVDLLKKNNINPKTIQIRGWNDFSPAAASEKVIYVNEKRFNKLSKESQLFTINHEIQHIINKDTCRRFVVESILGKEVGQICEKNHPLCKLSRLHERRADIHAVFSTPNMSKAYITFAKENLKLGDTPGITHPKNSDRLTLAHTINAHIEKFNQEKNSIQIA